jgi:hypothetical protein
MIYINLQSICITLNLKKIKEQYASIGLIFWPKNLFRVIYNASNDGLKIIADYIFGNNISARGGSEKIRMTSPVAIEKHRAMDVAIFTS